MKIRRKFIVVSIYVVLFMMLFMPLPRFRNNFVEISSLIRKFGHPGVVPSPDLIEKCQASGRAVPKVTDWVRPLSLTTGSRNVLIILIDFPDKNATKTPAHFMDFVFGGEKGSLRHYYAEVSYGLLNITGFIAGNKWYKSDYNMTWWGADSEDGIDDKYQPIFELAREAVEKADADVDFSVFDVNENKVLDPEELSLCIIHAGDDQAYSGVSTDIWSHFWYIFGADYGYPDLIVDGVRLSKHQNDNVGGYWMVAEFDPLGVYAHEFGHDLGLPDLYDTDYSSRGVGVWCLMSYGAWLGSPVGSSPAHLSAWCKAKLGWINPTVITNPLENVTIPSIETSSTAYKLQVSQTEYFLVVNRQKMGYDYYLPGSGILIWHVDESVGDNTNENHKLVDLEEAHGEVQDLDFADRNAGDAYDPFFSPHKTEFTDYSDPNCRAYNGNETRLWITNISSSGLIMTANFLINLLPKANFTVEPSAPYYAPATLTFNASGSTTLYGEIESYAWDFETDGVIDAYGVVVNYTFWEIGTYTVTLNVTNSEGYWALAHLNLTIDKRDIALLEVSSSVSETYIGQKVLFNLTVINLGTVVETFNVTLYLNETVIAILTVDELSPNQTDTITFEWTVQGVELNCLYIVWAKVPIIPFEFDTTNNTYIDGIIRILEAKHAQMIHGSSRRVLR